MHNLIKKIISVASVMMLVFFCKDAASQSGWMQLVSGTSSSLNSVYFVNDYTGFMVGDGIAITTTNGGFSWFIIPGLQGGTSVKFVDSRTGFVANGQVSKTTDGGFSWTTLNTSFIRDISFVDDNTGYAVGDYSTVLKTVNGGVTWQPLNLYYNVYTFKSVQFLNANTGYVAGGSMVPPYNGIIYKTVNGGQSWYQVVSGVQNIEFRSMSFPNSLVSYAVGGDVTHESGVIFKSSNGGESWTQEGITDHDLNSVFFLNSDTGYTVGDDGTVFTTLEGSEVWYSESTTTNSDLKSVYFSRPGIGYTAGISGNIQKTYNGGSEGSPFTIAGIITYRETGQPVPGGKVVAIRYDYVTGLITKLDSAIIQSNGTYALIHLPPGDSTDVMAYQDDELTNPGFQMAFVPGFYGSSIFWTNAVTLYTSGNLTNINFTVNRTSSPTGVRSICGGVFTSVGGIGLSDARIYAKVDSVYYNAGISYSAGAYCIDNLPSGNYQLICDRMGYRSAGRNVVLGTVDSNTVNFYLDAISPIGIINHNLNIPSTYRLMQNYPNPFNPATEITFDIPKESKVSLIVYDILGREVSVLVSSNLQAGTYKFNWDAYNFASGLYFYKLTAGNYSEVKKMVLVK